MKNKKYTLLITLIILIASTSCATKSVIKNDSLEGKWNLELQSNDIGLARTSMMFETNGENFEAYTRKNAVL